MLAPFLSFFSLSFRYSAVAAEHRSRLDNTGSGASLFTRLPRRYWKAANIVDVQQPRSFIHQVHLVITPQGDHVAAHSTSRSAKIILFPPPFPEYPPSPHVSLFLAQCVPSCPSLPRHTALLSPGRLRSPCLSLLFSPHFLPVGFPVLARELRSVDRPNQYNQSEAERRLQLSLFLALSLSISSSARFSLYYPTVNVSFRGCRWSLFGAAVFCYPNQSFRLYGTPSFCSAPLVLELGWPPIQTQYFTR